MDVWAQFLMERPWAVGQPLRPVAALGHPQPRQAARRRSAGRSPPSAPSATPWRPSSPGLGIGGLALAFGAQKTIENLFGSISLAADQPFRVGDFVKIEDFTGNVERIGMRSTQIRTLDRTLISLPNGKLADMQIEDFASRDRIRLAATVSLAYGTTEEQVRRVVAGIETMLRAHPKVWPEVVVARLAALSVSSLDVEVLCWFETRDYGEFRDYRQEALLGIMGVVREAGTGLAFPTQTVHVASVPDPSRARPAGPQRVE